MHKAVRYCTEKKFSLFVKSIQEGKGSFLTTEQRIGINTNIWWHLAPPDSRYWSYVYEGDNTIINDTLINYLLILLDKKEPKVTGMCKFLTEKGL